MDLERATERQLKKQHNRQLYSPRMLLFSLVRNAPYIVSTDVNKQKSPAQPQGGRNKREDPISPIYPPANPPWSKALRDTRHDPASFKPSNETDTGYVFPEPAAFLAVESPDRRLLYSLSGSNIERFSFIA